MQTIFDATRHEANIRRKCAGSQDRYRRACKSLAGGVSSGLRRSARPFPLYFESGSGSQIRDVDGNTFIDYSLAWGPLILGHAPEAINAAVEKQLRRGHTFGAQHDLEIEVAETLQRCIPCAERVCFANSGTEIVQVALRLARAWTGRSKHLKFEGHYHGWDDSVLVSYHPTEEEAERSGETPVPVGNGQRSESGAIIAQWNDRASVEKIFADHGPEIASLLCEPMLCNSGCIPPEEGFLQFLREITAGNGTLLIFDEVITGFRLGLQGGQGFYGVTPDLATFAKAAGGGLPLSILAGRADVMDLISGGKVVHAGTLNGNPVVLASAKATLDVLSGDNGSTYRSLFNTGEKLRTGLEQELSAKGIAVVTTGAGPVFQIHFQSFVPRNYRDTLSSDRALYSDFAIALLDEGIMILPDGRWYVSVAHSHADVEKTLEAVRRI